MLGRRTEGLSLRPPGTRRAERAESMLSQVVLRAAVRAERALGLTLIVTVT